MDADRFDRIAKRLGLGLSRRRLVGGLAAVSIAGAVPRPAAARVALPRWPTDCFPYPSCCITPILNGPGCVCEGCDADDDDGDDNDEYTAAAYQVSSAALAGVTGSGAIRTAEGVAHFTLFASRLAGIADLPPDSAVPIARLQWRDPDADLILESTQTVFYGPLEGVEGGRGVVGRVRVNGEGDYLYTLRAVAAEPLGQGQEEVGLLVGDAVTEDLSEGVGTQATGFAYAAEGRLVAGDLQLLDVNLAEQFIQSTAPAT